MQTSLYVGRVFLVSFASVAPFPGVGDKGVAPLVPREGGREDLRFELCFKRGHPRLSRKHISTAGHFARSLVCLAEICRLDFECRLAYYSTFVRFEKNHLDITLNERVISKVDPAYVSSREFPFESHTK